VDKLVVKRDRKGIELLNNAVGIIPAFLFAVIIVNFLKSSAKEIFTLEVPYIKLDIPSGRVVSITIVQPGFFEGIHIFKGSKVFEFKSGANCAKNWRRAKKRNPMLLNINNLEFFGMEDGASRCVSG